MTRRNDGARLEPRARRCPQPKCRRHQGSDPAGLTPVAANGGGLDLAGLRPEGLRYRGSAGAGRRAILYVTHGRPSGTRARRLMSLGPTLPRPALADPDALRPPSQPRSPASGDYPPAMDRHGPPCASMSGSPACRVAGRAGLTEPPGGIPLPSKRSPPSATPGSAADGRRAPREPGCEQHTRGEGPGDNLGGMQREGMVKGGCRLLSAAKLNLVLGATQAFGCGDSRAIATPCSWIGHANCEMARGAPSARQRTPRQFCPPCETSGSRQCTCLARAVNSGR